MGIARHGAGPRATLAAFASQIHPVFMLPAVAAGWFGALLALPIDPVVTALHTITIAGTVYTAHVKDGYIDFYVREEDDDHPLTPKGCWIGLLTASLVVFGSILGLWYRVDLVAVLLTVPAWAIAYLHAPQLDLNPIGVTLGYPTGIALAVLSGAYIQHGSMPSAAVAFGTLLFILLAGIKIVDDEQDLDFDRDIGKPTVAAYVGGHRARELAYGLIAIAIIGTIGAATFAVIPRLTILGALAFGVVGWFARGATASVATALLIRGAYLYLAGAVFAVWLHSLG